MNTIDLLKAANHWKGDTTMTTTAKTTHTPTPWYVTASNPEGPIVADGGITVTGWTHVEERPQGGRADSYTFRDAAHIVHCVNTYPALLAALKALHQANAETFEGLPNYDALWDAAANAIALAEGSTL